MKKVIFLLLLLLPLAAVGMYGYGRNLPESYEVTRRATYHQPIASVWRAITDYKQLSDWSEHIEKVEKQDDQEGLSVWRVFCKDEHYMDIQTVRSEEPALFVSRIVESDLPFGGSWTFLLVKKGDETTQVTLKEEGYIASPLWRLAMKFIMGKHTMTDQYLTDLGQKFGETPEIVQAD